VRLKNKIIASITGAALLVGGTAGVAFATDPLQSFSGTVAGETLQERYTDEEILTLLLDGSGRVAEENPVLLERLAFADEHEHADSALLAQVIDDYLIYNPAFEDNVLTPLTSGDPELVETGLATLTSTYLEMLQTQYGVEMEASRAQVDCGAGAWLCVVAYVGGFVNVALYANAAVATLAVVALAVVPAAVTYLMDEDSGESVIVKNELIAELTRALAK